METTKVEYYNGNTLIGERTTEPFNEYLWENAPIGEHVITAKLYVDGTLVDETDPVTIIVNEEVEITDITLVQQKTNVRQYVTGGGQATVILDNEPTPGNTLIIILSTRNSTAVAPGGYTLSPLPVHEDLNAFVMYKEVGEEDTKEVTVTIDEIDTPGDDIGILTVLEYTGIDVSTILATEQIGEDLEYAENATFEIKMTGYPNEPSMLALGIINYRSGSRTILSTGGNLQELERNTLEVDVGHTVGHKIIENGDGLELNYSVTVNEDGAVTKGWMVLFKGK